MKEITQLSRERKSEINSRLFDIREILTGSGVTGSQRIDLEAELKELSLELYAESNLGSTVSGREKVVALAEDHEKRAEDELLSLGERQQHKSVADAIRQGIITSDVKKFDKEKLHAKLVEDGKKLSAKRYDEYQAHIKQAQKEVADARREEMDKQL